MPKIYDSVTNEAAVPTVLLDASGNQITSFGSAATTSTVLPTLTSVGTTTSVAASASSVTLLSSDATRKAWRMYNDSSVSCYVKYGTTASTTDFIYLLGPGDSIEENHYYGRVDAIWVSATGSMRIVSLA